MTAPGEGLTASGQEGFSPPADPRPARASGETRSAPIGAAKLETRKLSRSVRQKALVQDISVRVAAADILAVVGPSGAGKSSFLRLINRLDEPTSGAVLLDGADTRSLAPRDLRRRVGMVMQTAWLFPGTVDENIAFGPKQRGEAIAPAAVASLLDRVGLGGYESRDVANLSGGEGPAGRGANPCPDDGRGGVHGGEAARGDRRRAPALPAIAMALVAAAASAYLRFDRREPPAIGPPPPISVIAAKVERRSVPIVLTGLGVVTPLNTATIRSEITGLLTVVDFKEGQFVKKGDHLARIDPRTYQAALDQAEAALARDQAFSDTASSRSSQWSRLSPLRSRSSS